ncbi:FecCD family ABC transporter permease [Streptomyces sp. NPDC127068]|uniref:FecCD family ABC transporter permease n=1 Tax=Streptomyces sp. NPDC127068 TaxID=3347127 RepID=UPI0036534595
MSRTETEPPTVPAARPARRRTGWAMTVLVLCVPLLSLLALVVGSVAIPAPQVLEILVHRVTGVGDPHGWTLVQDGIVWDLRLPRVLLALLIGAALSVVGVVAQALVRNPLADPYLLGTSSGAALGAVASIVLGVALFGGASTGVAGFVGALAALLAIYAFVRLTGEFSPTRLLLAGVVVGAGLSGITNYLIFQAQDPGKTNSALFWLLGSLAGATWDQLTFPAVALVIGFVYLMSGARQLNAMLLGDETSASVGVDPQRLRVTLFVVAALLTGLTVSLCGSIGFVGLIVPHIARLLVGNDHHRLLPMSALLGALFLLAVDIVCRTVMAPQELPVGVITSVIGAPLFLFLMGRRGVRLEGS